MYYGVPNQTRDCVCYTCMESILTSKLWLDKFSLTSTSHSPTGAQTLDSSMTINTLKQLEKKQNIQTLMKVSFTAGQLD